MDEQMNAPRSNNPRRKQRSKLQIIKEDYLPSIILLIGFVLIITFTIGSIVRSVQKKQYLKSQEQQAITESEVSKASLEAEAVALLEEAAVYAKNLDYKAALAVLDRFSGDMYAFPEFSAKYAEYAKLDANMVLWDDPSKVVSLSFQPLIADPVRAYANSVYGTSYYNNFVTVDEFTKILQQLYENGYMLIRHSDMVGEDGKMEIYLPNGKKPLLLTETHVNYNTYMIDGDGDKLPDKDGSGFASKLIVDENGNLSCEMVDNQGNVVTGAYDIVPILNSFVQTHPDFSYRGARAVLALTGYDGLFGYRTSKSALDYFGKAFHDQQIEGAKKVIEAVKNSGYELACYSYENEPYGTNSTDFIKNEMELWKEEVTPLLGEIKLFVFCRNSDIGENGVPYSGEKFEILQSYGFTDYMGFSKEGEYWFNDYGTYTRLGRVLVTGQNIASHPAWFEGIFDAYSIKDKARN